jgi:hypothetical protein
MPALNVTAEEIQLMLAKLDLILEELDEGH